MRRVIRKNQASLKILGIVTLVLSIFSQAAFALTVKGGGQTLITGGNGAEALDGLVPVKTIFAFNATKRSGNVDGKFECLALAPAAEGSGDLSANVMYVTGTVMELQRQGRHKAIMPGTARITGLGAGENVPFEATVEEGPTGATFSLTVQTLEFAFREIVIADSIDVN